MTRPPPPTAAAAEQRLRKELAGALRWTARLNLHEGVANHFSVALDGDGGGFLMNPANRHFSRVRASELLLLNAADDGNAANSGVDPTAWCLHGYFHRHLPQARCLMHTHAPYATALASLADWRLLPIDQNACRFFNRVAYDEVFGGMLLAEEEAARQCAVIGDKPVLLMRGHGVLIAARDVATAFDLLYYFERACHNQWLALATQQPLLSIPDEVAEKTARQWEAYPTRHFNELLAILDGEGADYNINPD